MSDHAQESLRIKSAHDFQTNMMQQKQGGGKTVGGMESLDNADLTKAISSMFKATGPLQIQSANLSTMLTPTGLKLEPAAMFKQAESIGSKWTAKVEGHEGGQGQGHGH